MLPLFFFSTIEVSEILCPDFPFEAAVCNRVSCNIAVIYVLMHHWGHWGCFPVAGLIELFSGEEIRNSFGPLKAPSLGLGVLLKVFDHERFKHFVLSSVKRAGCQLLSLSCCIWLTKQNLSVCNFKLNQHQMPGQDKLVKLLRTNWDP